MDKIHIEGVRGYAYHGALPAEHELGQQFIADVTMSVDLHEAGMKDDLSSTVHYGEAYEVIYETLTKTRKDLIEAVAEQIASELFKQFERVDGVLVTIKKPNAPISGVFDYVSVTIDRRRSTAHG